MIRKGNFVLNEAFFKEQTNDKETLLMHGLTFLKDQNIK